jgi:hypothetical protein
MSKADKREQRIRENTNNVSLEDFEALINQYGHIEFGGSHPKAIIGNIMFPYKRENPIKPAYVKEILEIIDHLK